jgi:carboxylate-amine ligase
MWRAVRHGLDGELLDLERREPYRASETLERLLTWCAPACSELGIEVALPERNGAQRQRGMIEAGLGMQEIYAAIVAETKRTYAGELGTAEVTR